MRIIDEKGRLFGKVNLIDLLVILLVVAIVAAAAFKLSGREVTQADTYENADMRPVSYTVLCRMVHKNIAENVLKNGVDSQLMSNGELVDSVFIEDIKKTVFYESYVTPEGEIIKVESEEYCDLYFVISGEAPYAENSFHIGSQEIRVAKSHIVKTCDFELTGTVMEMEGGNG